MNCIVTEEGFDWCASYWKDHGQDFRWDTIFVLPSWLKAWLHAFAPEDKPHFLAVRHNDNVIGIAPLLIHNKVASIIGSPNVCDYSDFIVAPGEDSAFFQALLQYLKQSGVNLLELRSIRPDSIVASSLFETIPKLGYKVSFEQEDISLEVDLPATWDEYLQLLAAKQRHELKRKLRRLEEAGIIDYTIIDKADSTSEFMDTFLKMFVESREDKATFMTEQMSAFFRLMTKVMAEAGLIRSGILNLDNVPVAAVIAFDYNNTIYLYNSAYDPRYSSLSVGILSKALFIKDSIDRGKKRFDFLKGGEHYKYQLGGREVSLSRCQIEIG
jgi:CelD/BcsL family acetyltransferase involved in cellulose biosynthesis